MFSRQLRLLALAALLPLVTTACSSAEDIPWQSPDAESFDAGTETGSSDSTIEDVDASGDALDDTNNVPDTSFDADEEGPDANTAVASVHYVGRFDDQSEPGTVRFGWPGSGLVVRFSGTGVGVRMDDPAKYFTVVVDGEPQPRLETQKGDTTYVLASGLSDSEHVVEMYRRTEGSYGPTKVHEVIVEGTLLAPPPVQRRIEVIGDSISCGYGNEGQAPCNFSADTENNFLTYESIAARAVGAELSVIAWSGKGMVYNYGDDKVDPMPVLYDRTIPTSLSPSWDFSSWQPDVVVIHLGTNDFSTDDDPPEDLYVDTYEQFLKRIRGNYPDAWIFCTIVPRNLDYTQQAVQRRIDAGDDKVKTIDLVKAQDGAGCNGHPGLDSHQAMAQILIDELHATLGW